MKYHINKDYEVKPCDASDETNCPFFGNNGGTNHYENEKEALNKVEELLDKKHNVNKGKTKRPTAQFVKNKKFISEALIEYGNIKEKDLQDVSDVKEMINEWFNGDREKYNSFRNLINDNGFTEDTKKSVAHLILRGLPVQKTQSVYDISSAQTEQSNSTFANSHVTILEDFPEDVDLEHIRDNRFSFFG